MDLERVLYRALELLGGRFPASRDGDEERVSDPLASPIDRTPPEPI